MEMQRIESAGAVLRRARRPRRNSWRPDENEIIRQHYREIGAVGCAERLPGRTKEAIRTQADRLGVAVPRTDVWPSEWVEALRALWAGNRSMGQCADALNKQFGTSFTREAISGKLHRLGLMGKLPAAEKSRRASIAKGGNGTPLSKAEKARRHRARHNGFSFASGQARPRTSTMTAHRKIEAEDPGERFAVPFIERKQWQCAWPLWADATTPISERKCCGAERENPFDSFNSYCLFHARKARAQ
jgi:hypothetical protein